MRHSEFEHCAALLMKIMETMIDGEMGRRTYGAAALLYEEGKALAIRPEIGIHESKILLCGLKQHCAGTIAEDGARGAVCIVDH
jgi:hypothetical protein